MPGQQIVLLWPAGGDGSGIFVVNQGIIVRNIMAALFHCIIVPDLHIPVPWYCDPITCSLCPCLSLVMVLLYGSMAVRSDI